MSDSDESVSMKVAVVGASVRVPGAANLDELWHNLREGVESITFLSDEELAAEGIDQALLADPAYVKAAATIEGEDLFDAAFFDFNPREAALTDPQQRIFLECAWTALEDAGHVPEQFDGAIGVFAGSGVNTYFQHNVRSHPELFRKTPALQLMIGAEKDYLAPRTSYKLSLTGPSVSVQTACSTSLVSVHLACQSLLDYQSDLALAGGVTIHNPQRAGYRYQEGGILSADGHCRPFDARAGGTVPGSGAAVVVLKRLEDAVQDGDSIFGVICGSALNNDGSDKVGFTAPGASGQTAVIAEALAAAGMDSREISYVETHGTGTALGDLIEITALHRAFEGDSRRNACALGSIKSNFGHLDTAAGAVGLLKTLLALRHRQIPPSLHFEAPNPEIDFAAGPFYINHRLADWPKGASPRRAGVSSFGIGGTNVHLVVEEAPETAATPSTSNPTSRPWQLLLLSARSPSALEAATERLARHLGERPELDLADVAHTLRIGRRVFDHRRMLVCRDRAGAVQALESGDPERLLSRAHAGQERPVVFLFPGQGAQYVDMGQGLYESEPEFRAAIDSCAEILEPQMGSDLRRILYPLPEDAEMAAERLAETAFTQPALFAVEYALARQWMAWGVEPAAMIGHSLGEYVAACLAEVFSLEEALTLVAERGRLMQDLPGGSMLSLPLPEEEVSDLLNGELDGGDLGRADLDLAAVNGRRFCVVSGPPEAVEKLRRRVVAAGVDARPIETSHAFHSAMMAPILETFTAEVAKVGPRSPQIPFLSSTTGTWIEAKQATDPAYWARHLRQTVRFADGLGELLQEPSRLFLEVGPGRTLSTFLRRHPACTPRHLVFSSLRHPKDSQPDAAFLTTALGQLWMAGARVDWASYTGEEKRRRVPLPTYPFERQRYWLDARPQSLAAVEGDAESWAAGDVAGDVEGGGDPSLTADGGGLAADHQRPELATAYVAPRSPVESTLAAIWQQALGLERVGAIDDFFELGGHSLLATEIAARARDAFQTDVPLTDLFAKPTVAGMADVITRQATTSIDEEVASRLPEIVAAPEERFEPFPLTDVQQAYWIGRSDAFELGGVATHIYREYETRGLDLARLTRALGGVIERHDILRAVVRPDGQQQVLVDLPPYEIACDDLRGRSTEDTEAALLETRRVMSHQVLPADRWPLFEVRASRLGDRRHRLHISFDMLIGDAWSWELLTAELWDRYRHPERPVAVLDLTFRDYLVGALRLEDSTAFSRDLDYWRGRLAEFPTAPELPLRRQIGEREKPRFERLAAKLEEEVWTRLKQRAARASLTASGVLLATFSEVLRTWSKNPRFALNLTLFNRLPCHPQVGSLIGDFTSLVLLAVDGSLAGSFEARAQQLQRQLWDDLDHRLVSGVRVLRELARLHGEPARAMMPVVFTSTLSLMPPAESQGDGPPDDEIPGAGDDGLELSGGFSISQTPQVWLDHQVHENDGALYFNWDIVEELFPPGLLREMFAAYEQLLHRLAEGETAWQESAPLHLSAQQLASRLAANATEAPLAETLLHKLVADQARERPGQAAVITSRRSLTYGELDLRCRDLALRLRGLGARPNQLVAVVMEKGWEQVVAVLGILEAGAAYLPIDPELPAERRAYLLAHGEVEIVLTQSRLDLELERSEAGIECLCVDILEPWAPDLPALKPIQTPDDLAYVIFTSGSTGKPKGVMIDHCGAVNTLLDINQRFNVTPGDRVLGLSSLSFDLSVYDIFGILAAGGTLVLPEPSPNPEPALWYQAVEEHGVTLWNTVPALMEMWVEYAEATSKPLPASLRLVMMSGDWIPVSLPARIRALTDKASIEGLDLVSLGGATEASIWSILHRIGEVSADQPSIPYGKPMRNQTFQVLDDHLEPRPVWVPGELFIGGLGLAKGYLRDPDKTAARFLVHPETGERLYRTGDLGRYLPDGTIQFLGREDFQVKIRGYRIELGEIEAALELHVGVREAVVLACAEAAAGDDAGGDSTGAGRSAIERPSARPKLTRLVAYFVPTADAAPDLDELRSFLARKLPDYMVPASLLPRDAWPLTANGKVDRGALTREALASPGELPAECRYVAPESETEEILVEICGTALGVERLGVEDDFFDLGGDSLMATKVIFQIRKAFEIELPVRAFFDSPTVAGLAERVEEDLLAELEALTDETTEGATEETPEEGL